MAAPVPKRSSAPFILLLLAGLLSACTHAQPPAPVPAPRIEEDPRIVDTGEIAKAQNLLGALGYDAGTPDGVAGPKTTAAIRAFQKDQRLAVDGSLTRSLLARLETAGAKLPRDTRSRYETGETFIYSDGASERIVDVADGFVVAADDTGQTKRPENFLLYAGTNRRTDAPDDFLQPLHKGSKGEYRTYRQGVTAPEIASTVRCEVTRQRTRVVPAGKFKTIEALCTEMAEGVQPIEREFAYAPALHQVVHEAVRENGKPVSSRELVAILPDTASWPAAARTGFDWAIVNALEESGKHLPPVAWTSTGVTERFAIRVDPAPVKPSGEVHYAKEAASCLRYKLVRTDTKNDMRVYPGLACKNRKGEWMIPARAAHFFAMPPKGLD